MNSSGIKRGLAATAVSALAIAGLPLLASSASAAPLDQAATLELVSQFSGAASVKNDGTDSTIRLQAVAPASISSVTFQYKIGATWQDIATVSRNDDGAFSHEWAPTGAIVGATVELRVVGTPAGGTQVEDQAATPIAISPAGGTVASVNLADGSALGVFQSPYATGQNVVVSGTTSLTSGNINIQGGAAVVSAPVTAAAGATTGTFRGVVDITGYTYGATDQLLLGATPAAGGSDDVEAYTLYKQVITTVAATASSTKVEAGQTATVTVSVADQNGAPIAGARVASSAGGSQITNAAGRATFAQGPSTAYYYADATDAAGFSAGAGDQKSADITVAEYVAKPTSLVATSTDGAAFDRDEYAASDITVQVKDQEGRNRDVTGQNLNYFWTVTPFDATKSAVRFPTTGVTTEAAETNGLYTVALPTGAAAVSGTYTLNAALGADALGNGGVASTEVLSVKVGQASVVFTPARELNVAAGSTATVTGKVALEDGTVLARRAVAVSYAQGTTGSDTVKDSGIVPATGTALVASRSFTSGADGTFEVKVSDLVETPQGTELGGSLDAEASTLGITAAQVANVAISFVSAEPVTGAVVTVVADTDPTGTNRPGDVVTGTAKVAVPGVGGAAATPVAGQQVTVTLDKGHFVTGANAVPAKTTVVAGDVYGEHLNIGASRALVTNADGEVTFHYVIGRDAGFDDDGKVTATVTATAGSKAGSKAVEFTSANPLNGGSIKLVVSPESVQRNKIAPTFANGRDRVYYDVVVTDQFNNPVVGEDIDLDFSSDGVGYDYSDSDIDSDIALDGDFWVSGYDAGNVNITAEWDANTETLTAGAPFYPHTTGSKTLSADSAAAFYEVDFAGSTFELTSSVEGPVEIGTSVTETVKVVDQEGRPVSGADVEFSRNGAGGDATVVRRTNSAGVATYTFSVTAAGTVNVNALVSYGIQSETLTDTITVNPPVEPPVVVNPVKITASITGANNGKKADKLTVKASAKVAAGAIVKLFKFNAKGKRVLVDTDVLNANGARVFTVADNNKAKKTKYVAVIVASDAHTKAESNTKAVR